MNTDYSLHCTKCGGTEFKSRRLRKGSICKKCGALWFTYFVAFQSDMHGVTGYGSGAFQTGALIEDLATIRGVEDSIRINAGAKSVNIMNYQLLR